MDTQLGLLSKNAISERILMQGELVLQSPLCIGTGVRDDRVDAPVLCTSDRIPYIPGTSLAGALQACLRDSFEHGSDDIIKLFWGSGADDGMQSAFCIDDALPVRGGLEFPVEERDGVSIDPITGAAAKNLKYNFDIVPAGNRFLWKGEVTIRSESTDASSANQMYLAIGCLVQTVLFALRQGMVSLGAHTTKGFGSIKLENDHTRVLHMNDPVDVMAYLGYCQTGQLNEGDSLKCQPLSCRDHDFAISADFCLESSLIVRSYSTKPEDPDEAHICSGGQYVLPGTSLKGALRSRAAMILSTLGLHQPDQSEEFHKLFGYADTEKREQQDGTAYRSRLQVNESVIINANAEAQTRIQIDRFTGGVCKGALLESQPLWSQKGNERLTLHLLIHEPEPWEEGLLLLLLKDLWTADLPIGGERSVGRGRLKGIHASVQCPGHSCEICQKDQKIDVTPLQEKEWMESLAGGLAAMISKQNGGTL